MLCKFNILIHSVISFILTHACCKTMLILSLVCLSSHACCITLYNVLTVETVQMFFTNNLVVSLDMIPLTGLATFCFVSML